MALIYKPLTQDEQQEERLHSEKILSFLETKRNALTLSDKQALYKETGKTIDEALQNLFRKLERMPGLIPRNPVGIFTLKWKYYSTDEAFTEFQNSSIKWGDAYWKFQTVRFLNLLAFAPKEIIRAVASHEGLHLAYRMLEPSCLIVQPISIWACEYQEDIQQEEQWVRTMNQKLGFVEEHMIFWELAVELGGEEWRPLYYKLKKDRKRIADILD